MTFHLKTTKREPLEAKLKKRLLIVLTLSLIFLGSIIDKLLSPFAVSILSPVFAIGESVRSLSFSIFPYLEFKSELVKENERLRLAISDIETLENRNDFLERELYRMSGENLNFDLDKYISARVIRAPDATPFDTFVLNKGEREGVFVSAKVYSRSGIPVGIISNVYMLNSVAKLLGTPGESYLANIGQGKIQATAYGRGGGNFEIILPHGAEVKVGDEIYLSEISELKFSKIEDVSETEGGTFVRVLFKAPYALFNTGDVLIQK